jgi:alkyl sulfatase BDS1-like metallo-beta-lactamase superfamily hydrolase
MNALEAADALWRGEAEVAGPPGPDGQMEDGINPFVPRGELVEIGEGTAFVSAFANVSAFETAEGLVTIDSGTAFAAPEILRMLREWSDARIHTTVFTHGHLDHVEGIAAFEQEAADRDREPPRVIAHESILGRFERYALTPGYNTAINARQFGAAVPWPTEYRHPDETYRDLMEFEVGGERFELHHAKGETDDATWIWVPGRKVLCSGDLIIWCVPNAGNPQKVQRYAREWAAALREMAGLGAEALLPGHGLPVVGADRVEAILTDTASLMESLHEQTVSLMNEGLPLAKILERVEAPAELLAKPYLRPIYDDPEFIVHNIWRLYGGWYDLDPQSLKPAPAAELGAEVARLAGGAGALAARARELAGEGELRLAGHLAELAAAAAPDDADAHAARAEVNELRAAAETSLMGRSIFAAAARESRERSDNPS